MNEAVAYLVLACGTGGDNRTTHWSSQALHKYGGIAWERGKAAIERLVQSGFVRLGKEHTRQKPRYELVTFKKGKSEIDSNELLPATLSLAFPPKRTTGSNCWMGTNDRR